MGLFVIINPNTSAATTKAMVASACHELVEYPDIQLEGLTATNGPDMITDPTALISSATEVVRLAEQAYNEHGVNLSAIIVGAFGDPGLARIRELLPVPCTGLAEASIRDASRGDRKFGIATTTPALEGAMRTYISNSEADRSFTGFRFTRGDPHATVSDPTLLVSALAVAVRECVELDEAEAVIIAGGPLASSTAKVAAQVSTTLVNPVAAATRRAVSLVR